MRKLKPYKLLYLLLLFVNINKLQAQNEAREEEDTTGRSSKFNTGVQLVKLKKSYLVGDGLVLRSAAGSLRINATMQTLFSMNAANDNISALNSSFSINRARITMSANLFDNKFNLIARVNLPSNNQSVTTGARSFNTTLQEAYIEYRPSSKHVFNLGLRADYVDSRETRMQGEDLSFINRSAISSSFDAIFDYGLRYKGSYRLGGKQLLRPYISITTGDSRSSLQKNFGGFKYGVRLDYLPFDRFSEGGEFYMEDLARETKPKLVVGVVFSYNDGASSALGVNGGRFIYGDALQKQLFPTYTKWGFDYLFKYSGFYSMGSFVATNATTPDGVAGEFRLNGTFNSYSSTQTASQTKDIILSRLNLGSGFNLQGGYVLASDVAVGFRYTSLNDNAVSAGFANYNRFYTLAINKYFSKHDLKIQTEIGFDEFRTELKTPTSKGNYYAQVMATIQL
jgi:hypothetical protein